MPQSVWLTCVDRMASSKTGVAASGVPDGEDFHNAAMATIRDDVIADHQPARSRLQARRAGVRGLRQLPLRALPGFGKAVWRRLAVFSEIGRYLLDFRRRASRILDARHFRR